MSETILDNQAKWEHYIEMLTPMDDELARSIFNDLEITQYMLRIIMGKPDLKLLEVHVQKEIENPGAHGVRLDALAVDSTGKHYNIEVQQEDSGAIPERARFYSSIMDCRLLNKGDDYDELVDTYVIFITANDVLKGNKLIYHIDRMISETGEPFQDGSHIIYLNTAWKDDASALGRLVHDLRCHQPEQMYHPPLANCVSRIKHSEKEKKTCHAITSAFGMRDEMRDCRRDCRRAVSMQLQC